MYGDGMQRLGNPWRMVWVGVAWCMAMVSIRAQAQVNHPTMALVVEPGPGTTSCPTQEKLEQLVAARLGYVPWDATSTRTLKVSMELRDHVWHGHVAAVGEGGEDLGQRHVQSQAGSCESLAEALVLPMSLAVDPMVLLRPAPVETLPPAPVQPQPVAPEPIQEDKPEEFVAPGHPEPDLQPVSPRVDTSMDILWNTVRGVVPHAILTVSCVTLFGLCGGCPSAGVMGFLLGAYGATCLGPTLGVIPPTVLVPGMTSLVDVVWHRKLRWVEWIAAAAVAGTAAFTAALVTVAAAWMLKAFWVYVLGQPDPRTSWEPHTQGPLIAITTLAGWMFASAAGVTAYAVTRWLMNRWRAEEPPPAWKRRHKDRS